MHEIEGVGTVYTAEEFMKLDLRQRSKKGDRVYFDGEFITINVHSGYDYDIPISRMKTSAAVLDWIHQVCVSKTWGPEITNDFLEVIFREVIPTKMWSGKG